MVAKVLRFTDTPAGSGLATTGKECQRKNLRKIICRFYLL